MCGFGMSVIFSVDEASECYGTIAYLYPRMPACVLAYVPSCLCAYVFTNGRKNRIEFWEPRRHVKQEWEKKRETQAI